MKACSAYVEGETHPKNIFIIFKNSIDGGPPFAIVIYAMSNPNIEFLLPSLRQQFTASGFDDVAQWAKVRMNEVWYEAAIGGITAKTARDMEDAIAALRWEMGDRW